MKIHIPIINDQELLQNVAAMNQVEFTKAGLSKKLAITY